MPNGFTWKFWKVFDEFLGPNKRPRLQATNYFFYMYSTTFFSMKHLDLPKSAEQNCSCGCLRKTAVSSFSMGPAVQSKAAHENKMTRWIVECILIWCGKLDLRIASRSWEVLLHIVVGTSWNHVCMWRNAIKLLKLSNWMISAAHVLKKSVKLHVRIP